MTDQLRAGIVGAGFMGEVHARAVRAAGGVVARVAASTPERSAEAATRLGAEAPPGSVDELVTAATSTWCTVHANAPARSMPTGPDRGTVCARASGHQRGDAAETAARPRSYPGRDRAFVYRSIPRPGGQSPHRGRRGRRAPSSRDLTADLAKPGRAPAGRPAGRRASVRSRRRGHWCDLRVVTASASPAHPGCAVFDAARRSPVGPPSAPRTSHGPPNDQGACGAVVISQVLPAQEPLWSPRGPRHAQLRQGTRTTVIGGRASNHS